MLDNVVQYYLLFWCSDPKCMRHQSTPLTSILCCLFSRRQKTAQDQWQWQCYVGLKWYKILRSNIIISSFYLICTDNKWRYLRSEFRRQSKFPYKLSKFHFDDHGRNGGDNFTQYAYLHFALLNLYRKRCQLNDKLFQFYLNLLNKRKVYISIQYYFIV